MKVTVTFSIEGEEINRVESEQPDRAAALAWARYTETLCILVADRDVTENHMVKFPQT